MKRKGYNVEGIKSSGPYSHYVDGGEYIFISGQTEMNNDPQPEKKGSIKEQTNQVFKNLLKILLNENLSFDNVVKVNVYLTSMNFFEEMNEIYKLQFSKPYPARTTIAVKELPLGADVEIEMIARKE